MYFVFRKLIERLSKGIKLIIKLVRDWIPLRRFNPLCYQAMSLIRTHNQLFTTTPTSFFSSVSDFISAIAFLRSPVYFNWDLEVATESPPEWDLNPKPLNSVQTFEPTGLLGHKFNSQSQPTLDTYSNLIFFV